MSFYGTNFSKALKLDESCCSFEECTFQNARATGQLIYANKAGLYCSIISCLFYLINSNCQILFIQSSEELTQNRCCYSESKCSSIYASYRLLNYETINSTVCINSDSLAPCCCCSMELTSFFNNHSYLYSTRSGEGCYYITQTPYKEDSNCFFSGSSCCGAYPVSYCSSFSSYVMSNFNFVNNTDSKGYFRVYYGELKILQDSVIAFKTTTLPLKLVESVQSGCMLLIERCFIIASSAIEDVRKVTLAEETTITVYAPTHTPFHSQPKHEQCFVLFSTKHFSFTPFPKSLPIFILFAPVLITCIKLPSACIPMC